MWAAGPPSQHTRATNHTPTAPKHPSTAHATCTCKVHTPKPCRSQLKPPPCISIHTHASRQPPRNARALVCARPIYTSRARLAPLFGERRANNLPALKSQHTPDYQLSFHKKWFAVGASGVLGPVLLGPVRNLALQKTCHRPKMCAAPSFSLTRARQEAATSESEQQKYPKTIPLAGRSSVHRLQPRSYRAYSKRATR